MSRPARRWPGSSSTASCWRITGDARYAEEIERSAYNDLLGAQAPERRGLVLLLLPERPARAHHVLALLQVQRRDGARGAAGDRLRRCRGDGGLQVNLFGAVEAALTLPGAGTVRVVQQTPHYPFDGECDRASTPERDAAFRGARAHSGLGGRRERSRQRCRASDRLPEPGTYARDRARLARGRRIDARVADARRALHRRTHRNVQESRAPDGAPVAQEVLRFDYLAVTRGPLVYATDLIDGYKIEETLRVPRRAGSDAGSRRCRAAMARTAPTSACAPVGRAPLMFSPYYRAGGRRDGAWRLTWMPLRAGIDRNDRLPSPIRQTLATLRARRAR